MQLHFFKFLLCGILMFYFTKSILILNFVEDLNIRGGHVEERPQLIFNAKE